MSARRGAASSPGEVKCTCYVENDGRLLKILLSGRALFNREAPFCACTLNGVENAHPLAEGGLAVYVGHPRFLHGVQEELVSRIREGDPSMVLVAA